MKLPLRRVIVFAKHPAALAEFYARAFGLERLEPEADGFVDLASGPVRMGFHKGSKASAGNPKVCFYARDVAAAARHLASLGAVMGKPRGSRDELWFCDGKDPEGNVFQVSNRS